MCNSFFLKARRKFYLCCVSVVVVAESGLADEHKGSKLVLGLGALVSGSDDVP